AALGERLGILWLTPQMDRLFIEGPTGRRRLMDRLVRGLDPAHAARVARYEQALRERSRLLRDGSPDPAWLGALEELMAAEGVAVAGGRGGHRWRCRRPGAPRRSGSTVFAPRRKAPFRGLASASSARSKPGSSRGRRALPR